MKSFKIASLATVLVSVLLSAYTLALPPPPAVANLHRASSPARASISSPSLALAAPLGALQAKTTSVTTTAEKVTDELDKTTGNKSCMIWNNSATILYVGGSDVDSTHGWPICTNTSTCPAAVLSTDVREAYYVSASGTLAPIIVCGR